MANTKHQNKRKYHIVYQTTNMINNRIYIGAHSTDNLNDEYCGSGTNINRALEKYGRSSFKKDILYIFKTPEEMFSKEKEIVTSDFLKRSDVYNIVEGGYGGYNRGSTGLKHLHNPISNERCAVHPSAVDKMLQEGWVIGRNMSSTTGTIWVYKNTEKKMIGPDELSIYQKKGWKKGLPKSPTQGKVWIYNPADDKYSLCDQNQLPDMLDAGWVKKKWAGVKKGSVTVNDGNTNRRIMKEELEQYIAQGWKKGLITSRW